MTPEEGSDSMTSVLHPPPRPAPRERRRRRLRAASSTSVVAVCSVGLLAGLSGTAQAAATAVPLGTAASFAVLAGAGITNTGPTTISGDIGTFPTTTITGSAGLTLTGTDHGGDAVTQGAKADLLTAYGNAAGQGPPAAVTTDLAGQTLTPGVYNAATSMGLTGALTLDAAGDPDAVFVFQAGSTLTTGSGSSVVLLNGAQACNVFWQVGSSATLGTATRFRGNVLADTSITLTTGASVEGRVLASNGAVTLDTNVITRPACTPPVTTPPGTTPSAGGGPSAATTGGGPAAAPTGGRRGGSAGPATHGQVDRVPVGSVDTGDGSTAQAGGDRQLLAVVRLVAGAAAGRVSSTW